MSHTAMTATNLAAILGLESSVILGPWDTVVEHPGALDDSSGVVGFSFCKWQGERGAALVRASQAAVVICPEEADETWRAAHQTLIRSITPRRTFILALPHVAPATVSPAGVHPSATVDRSAVIDPTASVGSNVVIGADVSIGPGAVIHPSVVIGRRVRIGERVTIFPGTVIGADGFGYERDDDGSILKFIHLGGVRIGNDVEIGANSCIDRGTLGDTLIDDGACIDNLVHVAHNVHIGKRAFVIALSMIGGSTRIEDDAWIAPGAVLRNGIVIGERAMVGLGAVVTRGVNPDQTVLGNPAKPREPRG